MKEKNFIIQISYHDVYPDDKVPVVEILKNMSREEFFKIFLRYRSLYLDKDIVSVINSVKENRHWTFGEDLINRVKKHNSERKIKSIAHASIFNVLASRVSMLELLRQEMSIKETHTGKMNFYEGNEIFIKALLLVNDDLFKMDIKYEREETNSQLERIILTNNFSTYGVTSILFDELGIIEMVKFLEFDNFCKRNEQFQGYLNKFLQDYNRRIETSWQYVGVNLLALKHFQDYGSGAKVVGLRERLSPLSKINANEVIPLSENEDYKRFRNTPLIELEQDCYLLTDEKFIIQKVFTSLIFALIPISELSAQTFFGIYDKIFSEKWFFYKFMRKAFKPLRTDAFCEGTIFEKRDKKNIGYPDFYIRVKNSIFIFEHKDIRIPARERMSKDYEVIEKVIYNKFVEYKDKKGKNVPMGVVQLAKNADQILEGNFPFDKFNPKRVRVYPILVTFDGMFNQAGLNTFLNTEFRKKTKGNRYKIADLTVMDINTLVLFYSKFANNIIHLPKNLNAYHDYVNWYAKRVTEPADILKQFISYFDYMRQNYRTSDLRKLLYSYKIGKKFQDSI